MRFAKSRETMRDRPLAANRSSTGFSLGPLLRLRLARPICALIFGVALISAMPALAQVEPPPQDIPVAAELPDEAPPAVVAQFTTAIEDREPIDQITFVETNVEKIYFFSDLRGLEGQTVIHRWIFVDKTMAEVPFEVRGPRWRVWSSKDLLPKWLGDWTVEVVNGDGEVIAAETFTYSAPDE